MGSSEICSLCEDAAAEVRCDDCHRDKCAECDELFHRSQKRAVHKRYSIKASQGLMTDPSPQNLDEPPATSKYQWDCHDRTMLHSHYNAKTSKFKVDIDFNQRNFALQKYGNSELNLLPNVNDKKLVDSVPAVDNKAPSVPGVPRDLDTFLRNIQQTQPNKDDVSACFAQETRNGFSSTANVQIPPALNLVFPDISKVSDPHAPISSPDLLKKFMRLNNK